MALLNSAFQNDGFDATTVNPDPVFEVLPEGEYTVMITDSEMKATKDGKGEYLNLTLEVVDGTYKGRLIFDRLNLVNSNAKAVEIAQRQLSQICHAVGVLKVMDSLELHNRPMIAKLGIEAGGQKPTGGKYEDKNRVKGYRPAVTGGPVPAQATAQATAQSAAAAPAATRANGGSKPPWAK